MRDEVWVFSLCIKGISHSNSLPSVWLWIITITALGIMDKSSLCTAIKKDLRLMLWLQVLHISAEKFDNKHWLVGGNHFTELLSRIALLNATYAEMTVFVCMFFQVTYAFRKLQYFESPAGQFKWFKIWSVFLHRAIFLNRTWKCATLFLFTQMMMITGANYQFRNSHFCSVS